jgi:hypothetical protein
MTLVSTPPTDYQSALVTATVSSVPLDAGQTLERARRLTKPNSADLHNSKLNMTFNTHDDATAALALLTSTIPAIEFTRPKLVK